MKNILKDNIGFIVLAVVFSVLPFVLSYEALATEVIIFSLAAIAFDLLLGYTGMMIFCRKYYPNGCLSGSLGCF